MRTLKEEEVSLHDYRDMEEARARIGHFLDDVYLTKRIHSSLSYLTPAEFEAIYREKGSDREGRTGTRTPIANDDAYFWARTRRNSRPTCIWRRTDGLL